MAKEAFEIVDKKSFKEVNTCCNCDKLLNVSPVFYVEETRNICGRCEHVINKLDKEKKSRQYAYENIAKYISYPCYNEKFGCNIILCWNEIVTHEVVCNYRPVACPLFSNNIFPQQDCKWQGDGKKLNDHIESTHEKNILTSPQFYWLDWEANKIFFTRVGEELVTVLIKYESNSKYYCLLMINSGKTECEGFKYELELFNENKDNSIILRKETVKPLADMFEHLKSKDQMLEINLNRCKEMINSKSMFVRFRIVKKNENSSQIDAALKNDKCEVDYLNYEVLEELKCPECNKYMMPPIYVCQKGHSVCSNCKLADTHFDCGSNITDTRNFTLEKLTQRLNYPCRNRPAGCTFVTTSQEISNHQHHCEFTKYYCVLICGWKGSKLNMYNHIIEKHSDALLPHNTMLTKNWSKDTFNMMDIDGELFKIYIRRTENNDFTCSVQHFGTADEPRFRYHLQIIHQSISELNLSITNICQYMINNKTKNQKTAVIIPGDVLKPFLFVENYFNYKITITEM